MLIATPFTVALARPQTAHAATRHRAVAARTAAPKPPPWTPYSQRWVQAHGSPDLGLQAAAGIVVDVDSRQVLWESNAFAQRAPASLTKMVTAMVALDLASLDTLIPITPSMTDVIPDSMGIVPGERVSVRDLLYGVFLDSGNDAAEALAQGIVSRPLFIGLMNAKVRSLGLRDTHFSNPTGLDDAGVRSTAYDLAMIAGYLSTHYPALMDVASTQDQYISATQNHKAYEPINLNKLLYLYPGATGLKTGETDDAGGCLVGTVTRGSRHLVSVILGSDVFFGDSITALDYGFSVAGDAAKVPA